MSGGSWNYCYSSMQEASDRLVNESAPERRALGRLMSKIAKAMHDIEWVDSGDCGEGSDTSAIVEALGGPKAAAALELSELIKDGQKIAHEIYSAIRQAREVSKL